MARAASSARWQRHIHELKSQLRLRTVIGYLIAALSGVAVDRGCDVTGKLIRLVPTALQNRDRVNKLDDEMAIRISALRDSLASVQALVPAPPRGNPNAYNRRPQSDYNRIAQDWI